MLLFNINLKHTKDKWDVIIVSLIMFSFDMLNMKMILYEQNFTLIDRNNAKNTYIFI